MLILENEKNFINNLTNNNYVINFDGSLKKISKYKFSKIDQFVFFQPELLITKKNSLIFGFVLAIINYI